jgi:hypothetical protein
MSNYFEVEELAAHILGVTEEYEESNDPSEFIEDALYNEYEISFDVFNTIIEKLLPLIEVAKSPWTDEIYAGFADKESSVWLVKEGRT